MKAQHLEGIDFLGGEPALGPDQYLDFLRNTRGSRFAMRVGIKHHAKRNRAGLAQVVDQPAGRCDTPVERNVELGRKYRINGTPTVIFVNGERVPGAIPAEQVEKLLAQNEKK